MRPRVLPVRPRAPWVSPPTSPRRATTAGAGGGGGSSQFGSVKFTVTGGIEKTAEYPFSPVGSIFGGAAGAALNFIKDDNGQASSLSIVMDPNGTVVVSYLGTEGQVPAAECTKTDWNVGATSGSGKFDCKASITITGSGATVQGGSIKGEFTAHA